MAGLARSRRRGRTGGARDSQCQGGHDKSGDSFEDTKRQDDDDDGYVSVYNKDS